MSIFFRAQNYRRFKFFVFSGGSRYSLHCFAVGQMFQISSDYITMENTVALKLVTYNLFTNYSSQLRENNLFIFTSTQHIRQKENILMTKILFCRIVIQVLKKTKIQHSIYVFYNNYSLQK